MKNTQQFVKTIILALVLSLGVSYAYAWTAPTALPPGGNIAAPINTSGTGQIKAGGLMVGNTPGLLYGLLVPNGNVGIGTPTPTAKLDVNGTAKVVTLQFADNTTQTTAAAGGVPHGKQRFTTVGAGACPSATNCFTVPAGVTTVWVSMSGGGGGGAVANWGAGGGADAIVAEPLTVTPGANYPITVGAGGSVGGAGSISSFGILLTKNGGGAGTTSGGIPGGPGGSGGSTYAPVIAKGGGIAYSARGGGSIFGTGGAWGGAGGGYGGGGGGGNPTTGFWNSTGNFYTNVPATNGGVGAPGFVLVEW